MVPASVRPRALQGVDQCTITPEQFIAEPHKVEMRNRVRADSEHAFDTVPLMPRPGPCRQAKKGRRRRSTDPPLALAENYAIQTIKRACEVDDRARMFDIRRCQPQADFRGLPLSHSNSSSVDRVRAAGGLRVVKFKDQTSGYPACIDDAVSLAFDGNDRADVRRSSFTQPHGRFRVAQDEH
jgi:hypothetical protein